MHGMCGWMARLPSRKRGLFAPFCRSPPDASNALFCRFDELRSAIAPMNRFHDCAETNHLSHRFVQRHGVAALRGARGGPDEASNRSGRMKAAPPIAPPHPDPRIPTFLFPPETCDTHCHVFGPNRLYPYVPDRPYTPRCPAGDAQGAPRSSRGGAGGSRECDAARPRQPRGHGRHLPERWALQGRRQHRRDFSDRELADLAGAGITGCRFTFLRGSGGRPTYRPSTGSSDASRRSAGTWISTFPPA